MKFSKNLNPMELFAEIMTNKYFLIFLAVFSAINIIGYLSMGYTHAVILFAMVAYLTFVFSKNMSVVLLVSVVIVNLYMHTTGGVIEGATSRKDGTDLSRDGVAMDGKLGLTNMADTELADGDDVLEMEEPETISETVVEKEEDDENPMTESFELVKPADKKQHPRIDYASTLESAYSNLESMLGSGGLQSLSKDTQKLMKQQSKLFESMEGIAPILQQAQQLMTSMNFNGDDENISGKLASSAGPVVKDPVVKEKMSSRKPQNNL